MTLECPFVAKRLRPPNFNLAVKALLKDVSTSVPELAHIKPSRIVVVAGDARRASRATVKPLCFEGGKSRDPDGRKKPVVKIRGKRAMYSITLRPLFFRDSTPEGRIATLLHELYHIHPRFDGTLDDERRHVTAGPTFAKQLRPLVRRYLKRCPPEVLSAFAYDGEVRVPMWLERPGALLPGHAYVRRIYTEEQLFTGTVRMITRRTKAAKPPKPKVKVH